MELVEGETLDARVRREGALPTGLVLEIATQATQALVAAEGRGIVHRDLKPTNLMLAARQAKPGQPEVPLVKVIDFGLAKAIAGTAATAGTHETRGAFVGTPAFASPEQFDGSEDRRIDHRADIYSLGVTLWYALCGRTPFSGRTLEEIRASQTKPSPAGTTGGARGPTACHYPAAIHAGGRSRQSVRSRLPSCSTNWIAVRGSSRPGRRWLDVNASVAGRLVAALIGGCCHPGRLVVSPSNANEAGRSFDCGSTLRRPQSCIQ